MISSVFLSFVFVFILGNIYGLMSCHRILSYSISIVFQYAVFKVHLLFGTFKDHSFLVPNSLHGIRSHCITQLSVKTFVYVNHLVVIFIFKQLRASFAPQAVIFYVSWHPPALPCRLQQSTIGRLCLNHRVRDGNGCFP